ncbi:MAG: FHA domain-containing protein [Anaerolineae bacterium]
MNAESVSGVRRLRPAQFVRLAVGLMLAGCVVLTGARPILAQGGDITITVEEVDTSNFPTVRVSLGVRDQNGVPVPDLAEGGFEIIEDGVETHRPASVNTEENPDAHVSLAIVIDMYRTMEGSPIETAQEATRDLLSDLLDQPNDPDRAAFVGVHRDLSTEPTDLEEDYEVPFTNDRNRLLNVINFLHERLETQGPGTPLYDAVIKAIRMAEDTEPLGRRALIVMTDGQDRGSVSKDSDTIQRASEAHIPVFTVGLSNSSLDEQYLLRLAENTGGAYQAAETPDDFSPLFSNVLTALRTQYVLVYQSSLPEDGRTHNVLVRVRTPTQTEAVQEYRMDTPAGLTGETEEEPSPTSEASEATQTPEPEPGTEDADEEEDWFTVIQDWVQDNTLLAILALVAIGLLFLALVVVVIIIVRRRGEGEEGLPPLEVPSYPAAPPPAFEAGADEAGTWGAHETEFAGAVPPPRQETVAEGPPPFSATPSEPHERPPAPPPFGQQPFRPSPADRTRILRREPKMRVVGLLIERDHPENRLDVAKPMVKVGRSQDNDLVIDHNTVSRQHAAIKLEEDRFRLYDLGSTNGTFVGEERIREPVTLEDGATVSFGEKTFIFKVISLKT